MTQPDRLRDALRTPRRCILCNWNGDIGAFAHMMIIHGDRDDLTVIEQMGEQFVVRVAAPASREAGLDAERLRLLLHERICDRRASHDEALGRCADIAAEYARLADAPVTEP